MSAHRRSHARRGLALAAVAVLVPVLVVRGSASAADDVVAGETLVGELIQAWPEHEDPADAVAHADEGPLTWVETSAGDAVRVLTDEVRELPLGATVAVTVGDEVVDEASAEEGVEPAREVLDASVVTAAPSEPTAAADTAGVTNSVTVVMVNPAGGARDGRTLQQVVDAVNGPVASFWSEQSEGQIRVGVTAQHDWIDTTAECGNSTAMWREAADRVGFVAGPGKHLLLYVTSSPESLAGCSYGLAEVGLSPASGGRLYVRDIGTSVLAHELGHNFGLGHSSGVQCDNSVETGSCRTTAYQDWYDVMGISWDQVGSLSAPHADRLEVLPAAEQVSLAAAAPGGTYTLAPISAASGVRGLELIAGNGAVYWLEYRAAAGRDGWLSTSANWPALQSGVTLRRASSGANTSLLLDPTPSSAASWGADNRVALNVGTAVRLAGEDFTVTVQGVTASSATVQVRTAAGRAPVGALDPLQLTGSTLTVSGWTVDPDQPTAALAVHVYVDGRGLALRADGVRPESAAVSGAGDQHGFSWSTTLTPGAHQVCAYAIDTAGAANTVLGCRAVTAVASRPIGVLDEVSVSGSTLTVRGWALDPDAVSTALQVHLYVDGSGVPLLAAGTTKASDFPEAAAGHGFDWSTSLSGGAHRVCAYAIDATPGAGSTELGCRTVTVTARAPVGALDDFGVTGSTLTVAGWALDPDAPAKELQVHVYVNGSGVPLLAGGTSRASASADTAAHGFSWQKKLTGGSHQVCVYALDSTPGSANTVLGCQTVTVPSSAPVGSWDDLTVSGSSVTVAGWAMDTDAPSTALQVHVYVDGRGMAVLAQGTDATGGFVDGTRRYGFTATASVTPGDHQVCVYAIDPSPGSPNTSLGCRPFRS